MLMTYIVLIAESGEELQKMLDIVRRNVHCGSSGSMQGMVR